MKILNASILVILLTSASYANESCDPDDLNCICETIPVKNEDGKVLYVKYNSNLCVNSSGNDYIMSTSNIVDNDNNDDDHSNDNNDDDHSDDNNNDHSDDDNSYSNDNNDDDYSDDKSYNDKDDYSDDENDDDEDHSDDDNDDD